MILIDLLKTQTVGKKGRSKKQRYYNDVIALDFETTSLFNINNKWKSFDYNIDNEDYLDIHKAGIWYAYAFYVNGIVFIGRTTDELIQDLKTISREDGTTIIYIHNLAFDFHFLLNVIDDFEVFARKPHAPMKAYSPSLNIEFRCSYMLSGYSLERYAELNNFNIKKLVGDLDYSLVRHQDTPLTPKEIEYLEHDVVIVGMMISKELKEYNDVYNIPITKTGKVRRKVVSLYTHTERDKISKEVFKTFDEFSHLSSAFSGGYTHANSLFVNDFLHDIKSKDLTSSYPAVMLQCKFPRSNFSKFTVTEKEIYEDDYCCLIKVRFYNLESKLCMTYLSESKSLELYNETVENGRVVMCDEAVYWLTDIDFQIIKYSYDFTYEIEDSYIAYANYLPNKYRNYIYNLYKNKQILKGIEGYEDVYMRSKEDLNSLYGMTVTNTIRDEVLFNANMEWVIQPLTEEEIDNKISKAGSNAFISYAWGVWVTAQARKRLWDMILYINKDTVYCDTDSIKYQGNYDLAFEMFNYNVQHLNKEVAKQLDVDYEIIKDIGTYDTEPTSDIFVTYGAKKYGTVKNGKIELTVSGLNKRKASKHLSSIYDFKLGTTFDYYTSGRSEVVYINNQDSIEVVDYLGNKATVHQKYGVCIKPTTYTLGMSNDFDTFVNYIKSLSNTTHLSQLGYGKLNDMLK